MGSHGGCATTCSGAETFAEGEMRDILAAHREVETRTAELRATVYEWGSSAFEACHSMTGVAKVAGFYLRDLKKAYHGAAAGTGQSPPPDMVRLQVPGRKEAWLGDVRLCVGTTARRG